MRSQFRSLCHWMWQKKTSIFVFLDVRTISFFLSYFSFHFSHSRLFLILSYFLSLLFFLSSPIFYLFSPQFFLFSLILFLILFFSYFFYPSFALLFYFFLSSPIFFIFSLLAYFPSLSYFPILCLLFYFPFAPLFLSFPSISPPISFSPVFCLLAEATAECELVKNGMMHSKAMWCLVVLIRSGKYPGLAFAVVMCAEESWRVGLAFILHCMCCGKQHGPVCSEETNGQLTHSSWSIPWKQ